MSAADPLESLMAEVRQDPLPVVGARPIVKVRYTHEAMIDLIISNPAISQNEIAAHFGYSPSWISTVMCSDAFKVRLEERRAEIVDPFIQASIKERFEGLVNRSLEILAEKLNKPSHQIPDQLVLRTLEIGSRASGYGAQAPVQVNVHTHLEELGGRLTDLLQRKRAAVTIDQEPTNG